MFKFNDISSKDMKVVCEEESNFLIKASINTDSNLIDDDDVIYNDVEGSINLFICDKSKIDDIKSWLNGKGILEYKNRITSIMFSDTISFNRTASIYTATINWIRAAYWFAANNDYQELENNTIYNEGNVKSYPIIRLIKNNDSIIDITINTINFSYEFPENENYVEIDCSNCSAKYDGLYRNENLEISYEFPYLNPGENNIIQNSGDASIYLKRKDCWL